jgi:hypothetical protein
MDLKNLISAQRSNDEKLKDIDTFFEIVSGFINKCENTSQWDGLYSAHFINPAVSTLRLAFKNGQLTLQIQQVVLRSTNNSSRIRFGINMEDVRIIHRGLLDAAKCMFKNVGLQDAFETFLKPFEQGQPRLNVFRYIGERPEFRAVLDGQPGITGSGRTIAEAIGDMAFSHPQLFGITLDLKFENR